MAIGRFLAGSSHHWRLESAALCALNAMAAAELRTSVGKHGNSAPNAVAKGHPWTLLRLFPEVPLQCALWWLARRQSVRLW
jgi:hypothetical protein